MPGNNRFRLDDEQRRTPMAPEAGARAPQETIGGRESGALMNRAFEDSDLMAQSQDLELEVKARTKDRTQCDDHCEEKCDQGSGHRKENIRKEVPAVRLSARLHPCCVDPHTNLGQMDSSIES